MADKVLSSSEIQFAITLYGNFDAKQMAYQSRLENTSTSVRWVVTGDLAKALQNMIEKAKTEN